MAFGRRNREGPLSVVDMHCHILPGLDDGSQDLTETVEMLEIAASEGIREMVVTPHFNSSGRSAPPEKVLYTMERVQAVAQRENIPIQLYPGNEVYFFEELPRFLRENRVMTLNRSRHVLIEFSPSAMFQTIRNAMDSVLGTGFVPVLAHVERYECMVGDAENAEFLWDMGVELQVNAASVVGKTGASAKKLTHSLLKDGLVSYVATDAHSSGHRAPEMEKCLELLLKKYSSNYVSQILRENAVRAFGLAARG